MNQARRKSTAMVALAAIVSGQLGTTRTYARADSRDDDHDSADEHVRTATPIKHVIVIIGENRTFDNVYGTYVPREGQHVANLLSRGIVHGDGSPGANHAAAEQSRLSTINPVAYFIDSDKLTSPGKLPYGPFLPTPEAGFAPPQPVTLAQLLKDPVPSAPPFDAHTFSTERLHTISPVLERDDLFLLTTGATGFKNCTADPTEPPSSCAVASRIHQVVTDLNPNVPVSEIRTMDSLVNDSTQQSRSMTWLFVAFAGAALLLAAIGTYGVVSYSTAQRTFEIGMRVTLGATKRDVLRMVLGQSLRLVMAGVALGVVTSLALTRMLVSFLYGTTATDPMAFLAVCILLVAVALLVGYLPARRAARLDPLDALRVE